MLIWPESVRVLFPKDKLKEGKFGVAADNTPTSPHKYAENEFREPFPGYPEGTDRPNPHAITIMLGIWFENYNKIRAYAWKYRNTYNLHDIYNATWVSCGYNDGSWDQAIDLCIRALGPRYKHLADKDT